MRKFDSSLVHFHLPKVNGSDLPTTFAALEQRGITMHYHIYCKEKGISSNYHAAISEFEKRLSAYCNTTLHADTSLSFPKEITPANHHFIYIRNGLSTYSSKEFSECINKLQQSGKSTFHVVIGFTENEFYEALSPLANYDIPLSFSLTRSSLSWKTLTLLFYEQLYRSYTILQGKTYHK